MASIAFTVNDLQQIINDTKSKGFDTIIFSATGSVIGNASNAMSRLGVHIGHLPFKLMDDPREDTYWPEVKHKLVISKSFIKNSIHYK